MMQRWKTEEEKTMKTSKENTEAALLCDNMIYDTIYMKDNDEKIM